MKCQKKCLKANVKLQMKNRKSFTLVEILVSLAILMMLVGAMVNIEVSNIKLADSGKRQLQATGLARGALNLTRTIRDTSILQNPTGDPFANVPTGTPQYLKKTGDTWSLTTTPTAATYYPPNNINPLDGTVYTVEITVE